MLAIVHIGLPKTGSTSIQRFLRNNNSILADEKVEVRCDGSELLNQTGKGSSLSTPHGECGTWIYSDERLSFAAKHQTTVERMIGSVSQFATQVRVLAYVRRQDEVFISSYFSRLLRGEQRRFAELQQAPLQRPFKQLRPWEKEVGRDNLIVRRYGKSYLHKGLISDFQKHCGLGGMQLTVPPNSNISPSLEMLELLRLLNVRFYDHPLRHMLLKKIARLDVGVGRLGMSRRARMQLVSKIEDEQNVVAARYLDLPQLFDHEYEDNHTDQPSLSAEQVIEMADRAEIELQMMAVDKNDLEKVLDAFFAAAKMEKFSDIQSLG